MDKTVLFLEDDNFINELYTKLLEEAGFDVTSVKDGLSGLLRLMTVRFDMVLSGILLPMIDGLTVLDRVNELELLQGQYIFLTNLGQDKIIKKAFDLGAVAYFIKSENTPDTVIEKLKEIAAVTTPTRARKDISKVEPSLDIYMKHRDQLAGDYVHSHYNNFESENVFFPTLGYGAEYPESVFGKDSE